MPTKVRGRAVTALSFWWASGALFLAFLSWLVMPTLGWQYLVALSTLPMLLFLLIAPKILPETPIYLASIGKKEKVQEILNKVKS